MFGYHMDLAIRSLRHNKVLTALMVLAIAVGIGASMTTLTIMRLLSGDPIPDKSASLFYAQVDPIPDRSYSHTYPPDMLDYRSAVDLWSSGKADREALIVNSPVKMLAPDVDQPALMETLLSTTADFFPMFEVPFQYGTAWSSDDDKRHSRVVVISSDLNDKLFAGADSVGLTLRLRNTDMRIVGVMKPWRPTPQFYDVRAGRYSHGQTSSYYSKPEDVMAPFTTSLEVNDGNFQQFNCWEVPKIAGHLVDSACVWIGLWVELNSTAKIAAYRTYLADYAAQQKSLGRFAFADNAKLRSLMDWLAFNRVVPSDVRMQTWLALSFLAICLFNTIGLLLVKFLRRGGEIGVRRALGASRKHIFWQYMTEAVAIGLLGGLVGWLLTLLGLALIRMQTIEYADLAHLDISMFCATFALAIVVSLLAGTLPALRASRVAPALQLKTL